MRLAVLATALALACGDAVLMPRDALQLSVAVAQPVIQVGDSTVVTMTLRNRGPLPIAVTTGGCGFLPSVAVKATAEIVYPPGGKRVCTLELRRRIFAPGSQETQQLVVYGGQPGPVGRISLGRGEYAINATLQSSEFPLRAGPVSLSVE